jgi:hypothetical protein
MSETMSASITIGGHIPGQLVLGLCEAIDSQQVSLEFGGDQFSPGSAEDLLAARVEQNGQLVLQLCDEQALWGWFETLEPFLQKHAIAFDRQTDAKFEYGATLVQFRPGLKTLILPTDSEGHPVVRIGEIRPVLTQLTKAFGQFAARSQFPTYSPSEDLQAFREVRRTLAKALPRPVPPLRPLTAIGGDS